MTIRTCARSAPLFAAIVLAAAPAAAESVRVDWNSAPTSADTVRVWADVTFENVADDFLGFAGTMFDVAGDDSGASRTIDFNESRDLGRLFPLDGLSPGTLNGATIQAVDQFQLPPGLDTPFNGSATLSDFYAFEYTITDRTPRTVDFTSVHSYFKVYTGAFTYRDIDVSVSGTSFQVASAVIPLPNAAALGLVGVGLVATRRHR